jgi:hypothetical protein
MKLLSYITFYKEKGIGRIGTTNMVVIPKFKIDYKENKTRGFWVDLKLSQKGTSYLATPNHIKETTVEEATTTLNKLSSIFEGKIKNISLFSEEIDSNLPTDEHISKIKEQINIQEWVNLMKFYFQEYRNKEYFRSYLSIAMTNPEYFDFNFPVHHQICLFFLTISYKLQWPSYYKLFDKSLAENCDMYSNPVLNEEKIPAEFLKYLYG